MKHPINQRPWHKYLALWIAACLLATMLPWSVFAVGEPSDDATLGESSEATLGQSGEPDEWLADLPEAVRIAAEAMVALPEPESLDGEAKNAPAEAIAAARALVEGLSEADLALLPGSLLEKLAALEHIRDTLRDCMEDSCPWHYPPEVLAEMAREETPEMLTLTDLVQEYGVSAPVQLSGSVVTIPSHPLTLVQTEDNEDGAHTGTPDGDIDKMLRNGWGFLTPPTRLLPFEVSFTIPEDYMPTQSAYVAIKAYDVDEESGERDYVYINDDVYDPRELTDSDGNAYADSHIGFLSGENNRWSTTILQIPLEKLQPGKNVVSVSLAEGCEVKIDWMQLILDGGTPDMSLQSFQLTLGVPVDGKSSVQVPATATVGQTGNTTYKIEYVLHNPEGEAIDLEIGTITDEKTVYLSMGKIGGYLPNGQYTITALLKRQSDEQLVATDTATFQVEGGEVAVAPALTHTLNPEPLNAGPVQITVSVEDDRACTEILIEGGQTATRTAETNGDYTFTVSYRYAGELKQSEYVVTVENIDDQPPVIAERFTDRTLQEDAPVADAKAYLEQSIEVTDNRGVKGIDWPDLEEALATPGSQTVTVTATDLVGNTATRELSLQILPEPLTLTQPQAVPVAEQNAFALTATLAYTGVEPIAETGFVWGSMPSPTLTVNNGWATTGQPVAEKGAELGVTAAEIVDGVTYYARAYAKTTTGAVYYSDAQSFGLNARQYGRFSIEHTSDGTFTVRRTDGSAGAQTVYYRTVNGSAVGGTHFDHASGTLAFAEGETEKTVAVTEYGPDAAYEGHPATGYANAARSYQVEIYRVDGGATLREDARVAIRTLPKGRGVSKEVYTKEYAKNHQDEIVNQGNMIVYDEQGKPIYQDGKILNRTINSMVFDHSKVSGDKGDGSIYFINDRLPTGGDSMYVNPIYTNRNWNTSARVEDGRFGVDADYLRYTAQSYLYRYELHAKEGADGWEHAWIGKQRPLNADSETRSAGGYTDAPIALDDAGIGPALWTGVFELPKPRGGETQRLSLPAIGTGKEENFGNIYKHNGSENLVTSRVSGEERQYLRLDIGDTVYDFFAATGKDSDSWEVMGFTDYIQVEDTKEPQLLAVAPMGDSTYKPGDAVTISLIFDEIVDSATSVLGDLSITTNWGEMAYAGGADTNVLYFTGTVPEGAGNTIQVEEINGAENIKDLCEVPASTQTPSTSDKNTSINVDNTMPTVTIADETLANGVAKATVSAQNADTLRYAWTETDVLPVNGWFTISATSPTTVSTQKPSGKWYLYVMATRAANGASVYESVEFDFGDPDDPQNPPSSLPELAVAVDNTSWARERGIQITTKIPASGALTYVGPGVATPTEVAGSAVTVTQNGVYTFTLDPGGGSERVYRTATVSRIDRVEPTLTLRAPGDAGAIYNELTFGAQAEDALSGVAKVEYAFTDSAADPAPADWQTVDSLSADGRYSFTYTATETTKTQKNLHVRVTDQAGNQATGCSEAFTVVRPDPDAQPLAITATVTGDGSENHWVKGPATIQWEVTGGVGETAVVLPGQNKNEQPTADKQGAYTAEANGLYLFLAADANGEMAEASALVQYIDAEAPTVQLTVSPTGWANEKTVGLQGLTDELSPILDEEGNHAGYGGSGIQTVEWKRSDGAYTSIAADATGFTVRQNGTYTVRLTDKLGNRAEYTVEVSGIDRQAPAVTVGTIPQGWQAEEQDISLAAADEADGSGIKSLSYALTTGNTTGDKPADDKLTTVGGTHTTVPVPDGAWYIYYRATDNAGNVTEGFTNRIQVDTQKPQISITPKENSGETLPLSVKATYGPSGGSMTVTPPGGTATSFAGGDYQAQTPGEYRFTATSYTGKTATETVTIHQVTFDSNGGSSLSPLLVAAGKPVMEPTPPTRAGYDFVSWQLDGSDYDFNDPVSKDLTLSAAWTLAKPSVTLSADREDATYSGEDAITLTAAVSYQGEEVAWSYQWFKDGKRLTDADGPTLALREVADSGQYQVQATITANGYTPQTAQSGTVTVQIAPAPATFVVSENIHTYDRTTKSAVVAQAAGEIPRLSDGDYIFRYEQEGQTVAEPVDAGRYDIVVELINPNFAHADASVKNSRKVGELRIAPAPVTFAVSENTHTYDRTAKTVAVAQTAGETPRLADGDYIFRYEQEGQTVASPVDAGRYDVVVELTNANFAHAGALEERSHKIAELTIEPRAVYANWSNLRQCYDGQEKRPTLTLSGVWEGDDCTASGLEGYTDAGSYPITAKLQGKHATNYILLGASATLLIERAPVQFTVSENSYQADGQPHFAQITASPAAPFSTRYQLDGQTVDKPTEPGVYEIWATIDDSNYRHSGSPSGAAQKIGVLTLYQSTPPALYGVAFSGGEGAVGTAPTLPDQLAGAVIHLPENTFTLEGNRFVGWLLQDNLFQPGDPFTMPASNVTFTAQWQESTYDIGGVVDQEGNPVSGAQVTLMRGAEWIAQTTTDEKGFYSFQGLIPGIYNLIASKDGTVMTIKVEIVAANVEDAAIHLPSGMTNSVVEVSAGTPPVVVGNLDTVFHKVDGVVYTSEDEKTVQEGGVVEVKFTAQERAPGEVGDDLAKMENIKGADETLALLLDYTLNKTVAPLRGESKLENLPQSSVLLEAVLFLPGELQGKTHYGVYRVHEGEPERITGEPNSDGEYFELNADGTLLTLHVRNFSTYAIAYTEKLPDDASDDDSDTSEGTFGQENVEWSNPGAGSAIAHTDPGQREDGPVASTSQDEELIPAEGQPENSTATLPSESQDVIKPVARTPFCLIDWLTGGRTHFGCWWCWIVIVAVLVLIILWWVWRKIRHDKKTSQENQLDSRKHNPPENLG